MKTLIHIYTFQVLYQHLDTFGHVNNAAYLQLFEEARWDMIEKNGYGLKKIQETKKGPTILDVQIRYKKELMFKEPCRIETYLPSHKKKLMYLQQELFNSQGEQAAKAFFTFAFFDLEQRKIIPPTEDWLKAVNTSLLL
ncbi:MAG: acyl-CoA thioesterase [Bdellovibrionales bacterium]|nr:acyl-CoA thioesterase [Bdellovibrionales bacterium]MCB0390917.1 acyl-CoA thioesterase [Bdellovibrionales bacterium]